MFIMIVFHFQFSTFILVTSVFCLQTIGSFFTFFFLYSSLFTFDLLFLLFTATFFASYFNSSHFFPLFILPLVKFPKRLNTIHCNLDGPEMNHVQNKICSFNKPFYQAYLAETSLNRTVFQIF